MSDYQNPNNLLQFIGYIVGILGAAFGVWYSKKSDKEKEIKLKQLEIEVGENEELEKEVDKMKNVISEMIEEKHQIEKRVGAIKVSFRIIFNQYKKIFHNDPDKLQMLEEVDELVKQL